MQIMTLIDMQKTDCATVYVYVAQFIQGHFGSHKRCLHMSHQFKEEPTLHRKEAYLITMDDFTLNIGTNRSEIFQYFHNILSNVELFDKFLSLFYCDAAARALLSR